jgi:hypothetical protein
MRSEEDLSKKGEIMILSSLATSKQSGNQFATRARMLALANDSSERACGWVLLVLKLVGGGKIETT